MKTMLRILLWLFILPYFAHSQTTVTWTGANNSSDWHDTGNWDTGALPDSFDNVVISAAALIMPILSGVSHIEALRLQAASTFTIDTTAKLYISSPIGDAVSNRGIIINHGLLHINANDRGIGPTSNIGQIRNYGNLSVHSINQTAITYHDIFNFHTGEITVSSINGNGIMISESLINRGLIRIIEAADIGLSTFGANHANLCTGQIHIANCHMGMLSQGNFSNQSEIIISNVALGLIHKKYNGLGQFNNADDQYIYIEAASDTAISADHFENQGYLDIHGLQQSVGLYVGDGQYFTNTGSGQINLFGTFESDVSVSLDGYFYTTQLNPRTKYIDQLDWDYNRNEYNQLVDSSLRNFLIHVPEVYDSSTAVPLLFMFHGSSGTGTKFYNISGWKELADSANFISVYPTAKKYYIPLENRCSTKWSSDGLPFQTIPGEDIQDDIPFVRRLLDLCKNTFNIDTSRIYICGFSNGGAFVRTRLLEEMPTEFSASASSGGFGIPYYQNMPDSVYLPHYDLIGSLDDRALSSHGISPEFPYSADSLLAITTVRTKIFNQASSLQVDTTYTEDSHLPDYNIIHFQNDLTGQGNEYNFCIVPNLGHSFANGTNHPLKYTDILWPWFMQWTR